MVYMLVVSFSWGVSFVGPASFDTYNQCKYHAQKIEDRSHIIGRPPITVTCEQKEKSK